MASSQLGNLQLGGAGLGDVESGSFPGAISVEVTVGQPTSTPQGSKPDAAAVNVTVAGPTVSGVASPGSVAAEVTVAGPTVSGVSSPGTTAVEVTVGQPTTKSHAQVISTHALVDVGEPLSYSSDNAYSFLVGGADRTANFDATRSPLNISRELNGRSSASFGLISVDGTYAPQVGEDVFIMWGSDPIFGGTIQEFTETTDEGATLRLFSVSATDYNAIMDRRVVYRTYRDFSAKEILMDLVGTYLGDEGVIFIDGHGDPAVDFAEDIVFNGITVADAVSRICDLTNWDRFIDDSKGFHFFDPSAGWEAGPQSLTQGDGKIIAGSGRVRQYRGTYTNVQWVRSSIAIGGTFTDTATPSTAGLVFKVIQPRFTSDSAEEARGFSIPPVINIEGATGNIPSAIPKSDIAFDLSGWFYGDSSDYKIDGTGWAVPENPKWQAKIFTVPHFDSSGNRVNRRSAGMYIVINEFDPDVVAAGGVQSVTVESPTEEASNQLVKVSNSSQITARQAIEGGSGKWEHIEDIGDVENKEEADALAAAMLDRKDEIPIAFTFQADGSGWKPGQLVSVNLTRPTVPNASYLVQRVTIEEYSNSLAASPAFLRSTVELVSGSAQITPVERARRERARERSDRDTASNDMVFLLAKTITGATNPGLATGLNRPNNTQRVTQKGRLVEVSATANTAPTGSSIQIDVLLQTGGAGTYVSVLPPGQYLEIQAGRNDAILRLSQQFVRKLNINDRIQIDVIQVGSVEKGKDVLVTLKILV